MTTLLDRIWDAHRIATSDEGSDLLHVDRSLLHDLSGTMGFEDLAAEGRAVACPQLHLAVPDHVIHTGDAAPEGDASYDRFVGGLAAGAREHGIRHLDRGSGGQGITHVVGLERAFTLPGLTVVCGDSHTSTQGAVGALAWGIGSTETRHVLATQALWMRKPQQARIVLRGEPEAHVSAKDVALALIGRLGADYGREHAIEFAGPYVEALSVEGRATLCNLAVELGARFALVAPDDTAFAYLRGGEDAPADWDAAVTAWRALRSDADAQWDKQDELDVATVVPQVTWGVSPEHVAGVAGAVPADPDAAVTDYIGLDAEQPLAGVPIDYAFVGSCANNRIEDLRAAAAVVRGRHVAGRVTAWIVPGSERVRAQAEREGLDEVFTRAGFEWRRPGCSMCVGVNGDRVPPGKRCIASSNRNFIGRQGPGARTHLASPATVAASALAGCITDPRTP